MNQSKAENDEFTMLRTLPDGFMNLEDQVLVTDRKSFGCHIIWLSQHLVANAQCSNEP